MEKGELLLFVKGVVYRGEDEEKEVFGEKLNKQDVCKRNCHSGEDEREGLDCTWDIRDVNSESHDNLTLLGTPTRNKGGCPFRNMKK